MMSCRAGDAGSSSRCHSKPVPGSASSSLVPTQDHEYLQDFQTEGNHCLSLVYRKAPDDTRIGLACEPMLSPDNGACVYRKKH